MNDETPIRILVVEDDRDTAALEMRTLNRSGAAATAVGTVAAAMEALARERWDAVILDYRLPDGDAWEIADLAQSKTPPIPVVLVTAQGDENVVSQAMHRGVAEYIRKSDAFWEQLPVAAQRVVRASLAKEALRETRERLIQFVEWAPSAVAMFDGDMRYLVATRRWYQDYGLGGRDIAGLSHYEVLPEAPDRWKAIHRRCLEGAVERSDDDSFVRQDGTVQRLRWEVRPWRLADGRIGGVLIWSEDITALKAAEAALTESEGRFRGAFETAAHGMALVSVEGRWLKVNRALCGIVGYTEEELLATDFQTITHPDDLEKDLRHVGELLAGQIETYQMEKRYFRKGGGIVWILLSVSLVRDEKGAPLHFVSQIQDIGPLKDAQDALRGAKEAAEAGDRAKGQFLANMSHEIRTPLNAILGLGNLLGSTALTSEQRDYVEKMTSAGRSLLSILNDVLDFSKIDADRVELDHSDFRLDSIFADVASIMSVARMNRDLDYQATCDPAIPRWLKGDPQRLRQVLINLAGNAVKFTETGSVRVRADLAGRLDGKVQVQFSVRDTGIGISAEELARLFQPFSQADATTTRRFGGTGLGLAISKRLIELMGGGIIVHSEPGRGSEFRFTLTYEIGRGDAEAAEPRRRGKRAQDLAGIRILVVEDNVVNQEVARKILERQGASVEVVGDGLQAVDWVAAHRDEIDLVLMDAQMPVMDGFEATRLIRAREEGPALPIIALTAGVLQSDRDKCLEAGMSDFVSKPLDVERLIGTILRHSGGRADAGGLRQGTARLDLYSELALIPGLDVQQALLRLEGDGVLLASMLRRLAQETAGLADIVRRELEAGQADQVARRMHSLKGSAGNFGFAEMTAIANEIETAVRDGRENALPDMVDRLEAAILAFGSGVFALGTAAIEQREGSNELDGEAVSRFLDMLKDHNFGALEVYRTLEQGFRANFSPERLKMLSDAMDRLDFETAAEIVDGKDQS